MVTYTTENLDEILQRNIYMLLDAYGRDPQWLLGEMWDRRWEGSQATLYRMITCRGRPIKIPEMGLFALIFHCDFNTLLDPEATRIHCENVRRERRLADA